MTWRILANCEGDFGKFGEGVLNYIYITKKTAKNCTKLAKKQGAKKEFVDPAPQGGVNFIYYSKIGFGGRCQNCCFWGCWGEKGGERGNGRFVPPNARVCESYNKKLLGKALTFVPFSW